MRLRLIASAVMGKRPAEAGENENDLAEDGADRGGARFSGWGSSGGRGITIWELRFTIAGKQDAQGTDGVEGGCGGGGGGDANRIAGVKRGGIASVGSVGTMG